VDNLRGADVVTAEGDRVRASANENPDLFWAIRGGGGNFGVVTSFEYALHEVGPELLAGQVLYPAARAGELLRFYRDFFSDAPDEVMCYPFLLRVPPLDVFPREFHGTLALDFVVAYVGEVSEGLAHLQPFRDRGDPILDVVAPQPYVDLQQAFDAGMGKGNRWYSRSQRMNELSDEAIDTLVKHLAPFPGEFTSVYLSPPGGARERVAPHATAYPNRSSAHDLHIFPGWIDASQDEEIMAWADAFHEAMAPHGNGSVYVNLLGDGEAGRVPAAYAGNYRRLKELKTKWDPGNLFRGNHNIPPSG
jgi:FAD/FMN-containing dehydrogenase